MVGSSLFCRLFALQAAVGSESPVNSAVFSSMQAALAIYTLIRFGVLPMVAGIFVSSLLPEFPVTANFSTWYSGYGVYAMALVLALAGYAFFKALAGRAIFKQGLFES